ncbi:hypothetical protein F8271_21925 [Micromonospora sp. ALFpr18c]|uniref:hypothetical protein n=1 Tax=Micromonospora sp. ALFpr18c TaxID=1458665 RepID=UPI00124B79F3|nr:hypothetical protein [Micromonospora sp. ALFpr18c]KAB1935293.1 hypothetical protein F8271_21925 [Micromonospora sp. ALFpr18c]
MKPDPVRKTFLAAAVLERAGYDVVILDRRLDHASRVLVDDHHVALLGVDSLDPRRLISGVGWKLAIDAGLGVGPADFNAVLLRRFPLRSAATRFRIGRVTSPSNAVVPRPPSPTFSYAIHADPSNSPEPPSALPSSASSRHASESRRASEPPCPETAST